MDDYTDSPKINERDIVRAPGAAVRQVFHHYRLI